MNRRNFIAGILMAGVAPAICRASSLMRVRAPQGWAATESILTLQERVNLIGDLERIPFTFEGGDIIIPKFVLQMEWTPAQLTDLIDRVRPLVRAGGRMMSDEIGARRPHACAPMVLEGSDVLMMNPCATLSW
jgi:hypothetical protein